MGRRSTLNRVTLVTTFFLMKWIFSLTRFKPLRRRSVCSLLALSKSSRLWSLSSASSSSSLAPTAAPSSSTIVSISVASRSIAEAEFMIVVDEADDVATTALGLLIMRLVVAFADDAAVVVDDIDVADWRSCCEWSRISFASDWGTVEDGVVGVVGVNDMSPATEEFSAAKVTTCELDDLTGLGLMLLRLALLSLLADIFLRGKGSFFSNKMQIKNK